MPSPFTAIAFIFGFIVMFLKRPEPLNNVLTKIFYVLYAIP